MRNIQLKRGVIATVVTQKIRGYNLLRRLSYLGLAIITFANQPAVCAELYKWIDEQGVIHFGDRPKSYGPLPKEATGSDKAPVSAIRIQKYTGLNGPPIPSSAGYTDDFRKIADLPMEENPRVTTWIKTRAQELTPPYLYELSRRLAYDNDKEAIKWFWVAWIRSGYDAARCADKTAQQGAVYWTSHSKKALELALQEKEFAAKYQEEAIELEKTFPVNTLPRWICFHGMQAMMSAIQKKPFTNVYAPVSEWPRLHDEVIGFTKEAFASLQKATKPK